LRHFSDIGSKPDRGYSLRVIAVAKENPPLVSLDSTFTPSGQTEGRNMSD